MARFKVHYKKRLHQGHLLPPMNVITEELSNQKHQPDSYRSATRKIMQERKKLLTNSLNSDIHHTDLNFDKRNAAL